MTLHDCMCQLPRGLRTVRWYHDQHMTQSYLPLRNHRWCAYHFLLQEYIELTDLTERIMLLIFSGKSIMFCQFCLSSDTIFPGTMSNGVFYVEFYLSNTTSTLVQLLEKFDLMLWMTISAKSPKVEAPVGLPMLYINSIPLMIFIHAGNVVGGNVGHDMPSSLSWIVLSWDLFIHLILPSMFASDNEKSGQITSIQEVRCSQFIKPRASKICLLLKML